MYSMSWNLMLHNYKIVKLRPNPQIIVRRNYSLSQLKKFYNILSVNDKSSKKDIKDSFLRLSKVYHPDNKDTGSHSKFLQLKEAYDAIKDGSPRPTHSDSTSYRHSYRPFTDEPIYEHRPTYEDYTKNGFGGPFASSPNPWEDLKRAREARRRYTSQSNFKTGHSSFVSTTLILGLTAWLVIYSCVIFTIDRGRKEFYKKRSRLQLMYRDHQAGNVLTPDDLMKEFKRELKKEPEESEIATPSRPIGI